MSPLTLVLSFDDSYIQRVAYENAMTEVLNQTYGVTVRYRTMTIMADGIIKPFVNENYWQYGVTKWLEWDMKKDGYRILISGPSGSGKTTLAQGVLSKISRHLSGCEIFLLDYKNVDFAYLEGAKRYFKHDGL